MYGSICVRSCNIIVNDNNQSDVIGSIHVKAQWETWLCHCLSSPALIKASILYVGHGFAAHCQHPFHSKQVYCLVSSDNMDLLQSFLISVPSFPMFLAITYLLYTCQVHDTAIIVPINKTYSTYLHLLLSYFYSSSLRSSINCACRYASELSSKSLK